VAPTMRMYGRSNVDGLISFGNEVLVGRFVGGGGIPGGPL
jgi:hypothetical protein